MSCYPEWMYSVYVDGELPAAERRLLEAHLVGCQDCRALVVALRDEAELMGDALHGRDSRAAPRVHPAAPTRALALGFAPSLGLALLAALALGALLEARLPGAIEWLNPFRLRGAASMAFDLIFLLRDEVPQLLEMAVAVAAMASVSGILTFALTIALRRWGGPGVLGLLGLVAVLWPSPGEAHFGLHDHRDFTLAAGETHQGTLVASGRSVNVDGVVDGDLVVLAERVAVRGEVRGNAIVAGQSVDVSGVVTGSLHSVSERARLSGEVRGDVYAAGESFTLGDAGRVGRDASLFAADAVIEGAVGRDLHARTDWMEVRGRIARNVRSHSERLALLDAARIGGDVDAALPEGAAIEISPGAAVGGEARTRSHDLRHRRLLERYARPGYYALVILELAAAFAVGMLLHAVAPQLFGERLETARDFFRSLGIGFLALVATPVAIALCAVTLVGIPLALIGAGVYLAALYVSLIAVAVPIGTALVRSRGGAGSGFGLALLAGLAVLAVAMHLPVVGWPIAILVVLCGLGLLVERARFAWGRARIAAG